MGRFFSLTFLAFFIAMTVTPMDAEAKRGGGASKGGGVFAVPGFSRSDQIIKVLDLPDNALLLREDGKYIDLGYIHKLDGTGKWIGHVGSSSAYVDFTPETLKMVMLLAGIDELPPVPERSSSGGGMGIWMILGALIFGPKLFKNLMGGLGSARRPRKSARPEKQKKSNVDWDEIDQKIQVARSEAPAAGPQKGRVSSSKSMAARPRRRSGSGKSGGFGRRDATI